MLTGQEGDLHSTILALNITETMPLTGIEHSTGDITSSSAECLKEKFTGT